jgi:hypothetical protein
MHPAAIRRSATEGLRVMSQSDRWPTVFYFQPNAFKEMKSPEELLEWERLMKEEVGLNAELSNIGATQTESMVPPNYTNDVDLD